MLTYTERIGPISIVGVSTTRAVGVEVAKGGNVTLDQRDNGFILVGRSRQWKADRERQKQRDSSHVLCPGGTRCRRSLRSAQSQVPSDFISHSISATRGRSRGWRRSQCFGSSSGRRVDG